MIMAMLLLVYPADFLHSLANLPQDTRPAGRTTKKP
jgi:hypothetical protein